MIAAFWLAGISLVIGAGPSEDALSLAAAIRLSLEHNDDIRIAANEVKIARARIGEQASRGKLLGGISGSETRFDNKTNLAFGPMTVEVVPIHQEALTAQLSQLIDVTGQVSTAVSQARLGVLASTYRLRTETSNQIYSTTNTYYSVLRAREGVKVAQAALTAYQEQLRTTTLLWKQGIGLRIDVDRANSQVADAERELSRRENDLSAIRSVLNDQIGRALDEDLRLQDVLPEITESPNSTTRADLITKALARRSEILGANIMVAAAKKGIKLAHADAEPQVSLGISGNYYPTTSFANPRHSMVAAMFTVSFPILDGGLARNMGAEAVAKVDSARAQEDQIKRGVALQVQTAALDVETARKRLAAASVSLESAVEARKLAGQRYAAQVTTYLEVTDAQAALTAAESAKVDATYDLLTAEARLERASGSLDSTNPIDLNQIAPPARTPNKP